MEGFGSHDTPPSVRLTNAFVSNEERIVVSAEDLPKVTPLPGLVLAGIAKRVEDVPGVWRRTATDWIWTATVICEGAKGIRLRLAVDKEDPMATLTAYDPRAKTGVQWKPPTGTAGDILVPTTFSQEVRIEYRTPSAPSGARPVRVVEVGYMLVSGEQPVGIEEASCEMDVSTTHRSSRAVARILFRNDADGQFYVCSGALVNDAWLNRDPLFQTAGHCIDSPSEAASTEFFWLYQQQENGVIPALSLVPHTLGAQLVNNSPNGDATLLRLTQAIPTPEEFVDANANGSWDPGETLFDLNSNGIRDSVPISFLGWRPSALSVGQAGTGIHHPGGTRKRISQGPATSVNRGCSASGMTNGLEIAWTSGTTEPGSSGSPLLDENDQLIGVLSCGAICGPSPECLCNGANRIGIYGAFRVAFANFSPDLAPAGSLYIDGAYGIAGSGSPQDPYRSLQAALNAAPTGATLVIQPGMYSVTQSLNRPARLVNTGTTPVVVGR